MHPIFSLLPSVSLVLVFSSFLLPEAPHLVFHFHRAISLSHIVCLRHHPRPPAGLEYTWICRSGSFQVKFVTPSPPPPPTRLPTMLLGSSGLWICHPRCMVTSTWLCVVLTRLRVLLTPRPVQHRAFFPTDAVVFWLFCCFSFIFFVIILVFLLWLMGLCLLVLYWFNLVVEIFLWLVPPFRGFILPLLSGVTCVSAVLTSAYVTQDDTLMTTLTVREAVHYSAQLQLPDSMSKSEKKERADNTIIEMGLQDAMNTRIGGWGSKGISGGQKRRVSICIEILTRPKLLFLDEPTSGLDSAASYYVMSRIASLDQRDGVGRTIIASIHQPSSEVFQLFHNLCLLSSGKTVYFGPASLANEFFASNGFPCPTLQNPSDHFLKTINKDFEKDIEQGGLDGRTPIEEAIDTLTKSYKSSESYQQVGRQVAEICNKQVIKQDRGAPRKKKKRSHAGFITQCVVLTRRSFVNMYRDLGYYWLRLAIYVMFAFGLATIYYDVGFTYGSIQPRGSLLMFVASFLIFMAIGGFPSFVEDMKVFGRERLNGHYGTSVFVIGNTFSSVPYLLLISLIPGAISYYLPGLHKGAEHFIYFACVLFACMMLVESLMMIVASIVPNFLMGIMTGAGIQGLMILGGGFFRLRNDIPKPFWRYPFHYIVFHKYAYQGLFKNEFEGVNFPGNPAGGPRTITGEDILRDMWQMERNYSKWVDLAILFGMLFSYRILFLVIVKTSEKIRPILRGFLSMTPKQTTTVMINPSATPLHGESL